MRNLEKLKGRIIEYEKMKLRFLKEQKIEVSTAESEGILENEADDEKDQDEDMPLSHRLLDSDGGSRSSKKSDKQPKEFDMNIYEELTFKKGYSKFRNFHGVYDDEEFFVDENCYLLYPPMNRARPSNIIEFKLIKLSSETSLDDEIVGWGVFPILNSELSFNEGRFKIPIMQGNVDEDVTLYRQIQKKMIDNLDTWVCNMYFEIEPLLIQKIAFDYDGKRMMYEKNHLNKLHGAKLFRERENLNNLVSQPARLGREGASVRSSLGAHDNRSVKRDSGPNLIASIAPDALSRQNSRSNLNRDERIMVNSIINEEEQQLKKQLEIELRDGLDDDTLMLESYSFSVSDKFNYATRNIAKKKMVYIFTEALADLGLKNINSVNFQLTAFVIILAFWSRMYMHYFGEYIAVSILGIQVSVFDPRWYTVRLHYEASEAIHEMMVISFGVLFNTLLFSIFTLCAWLIKKYIGELPHIFYKMICWYGIATALDFILILIVDCSMRNWKRGDAFKMYDYFDRTNDNGPPGIILTVFTYIILTFLNLLVLYYYLIFVHMGGRVIDIYQRLSGNVQHFFLPHDNEVSLNYLKWVCAKALRFNYRVTNFQEDVIDEKGKRKKVHFIHVYKFHRETHELYSYRSFIRDYDGAIKEMNITKKILTDDLKDGITGNLPPRPDRQRYFREDHYDLSSENKKNESDEEDEKKSGEDSPLKKSMDSKLLLKEDVQLHNESAKEDQNSDNEDVLISNRMDSSPEVKDEEDDDDESN